MLVSYPNQSCTFPECKQGQNGSLYRQRQSKHAISECCQDYPSHTQHCLNQVY
ncbi:hypothetical protein OIU78_026324 [Salix suchowensis]|nr:hypothetical protein OIU78_026324 [Salix suchowensis]